ncbi:hypothetical protein [Phytohabitans rumicis]|uniref:hypothetical protein n=1 Tax=Phytohabitans rumicis TaxID=1076125 RepID=UPI0015646088|nr:hypothetical protein [Phytohabitans rumicis]
MPWNWPRRRTITGGVALGGALTVVLVLAGVIHVRVTDGAPSAADASPSAQLGPLTAMQPELADALLSGGDLPEGYRDATATPEPAAAGRGRTEGCRTLFERPWDVAGAGATERAVGGYAGPETGALLRQALALFEPGGAARAVGELRRASGSCPSSTPGWRTARPSGCNCARWRSGGSAMRRTRCASPPAATVSPGTAIWRPAGSARCCPCSASWGRPRSGPSRWRAPSTGRWTGRPRAIS